jgi:dienelactone hydrolase
MKAIITGLVLAFASLTTQAAVQSKAVEYKDGDASLTGYLYWDDAIQGPRPGVMVVHEWWGLNDYAKKRAAMLAELGFVAFAVDMYGTGYVTTKPDEARAWMQEITSDVDAWRARAMAGLEQLKASGMVAGDNLAAIGYCFGGATVLHMAYANAPVKGVVTYHSSLPAAPEESKGKIGPQILVLHGEGDVWVKPEVIANFRNKLQESGAAWEMNTYGGDVRHGFTNPDAGQYGIDNLKYDERADRRSWARTQEFFAEIFD